MKIALLTDLDPSILLEVARGHDVGDTLDLYDDITAQVVAWFDHDYLGCHVLAIVWTPGLEPYYALLVCDQPAGEVHFVDYWRMNGRPPLLETCFAINRFLLEAYRREG